jgi:hypothetical protein
MAGSASERSVSEALAETQRHDPILIDQDVAVWGRPNILARFIRIHRASVAECFPLFAAMSNNRIGSFASLGALYADVHDGGREPSIKCTKVIRDMLLSQVDRRLQSIYRNFFFTNPPRPATTHEQRLAALETTRNDAHAALSSYDWRWLASWLDVGRLGESADSRVRRLSNFALPIDTVALLFTNARVVRRKSL